MRTRSLSVLIVALILGGCHTGTLPNPNDPADVGALAPENLRDQLHSISDSLMTRVQHREIDNQQFKVLIQKAADDLVNGFDVDKVDATKAWQYGDVFITAKRWPQAKAALQIAVEQAKASKNEDRRVNDSLRLARVQAEMGDVDTALKTARSVFDAKPVDSAPILLATLYEIVPAARGKGRDGDLAKLLEDAIQIEARVKVDPKSEAGQAFIAARPYHMREAWQVVSALYTNAKMPDKAAKALEQSGTVTLDPVPDTQVRV